MESELLDNYTDIQSDAGCWTYGERSVWSNIGRRMPPAGGIILDVGCFNGDFLAWLSPKWIKHGIEPSMSAAQAASQRGVDIVAPFINLLPAKETYDVVTAIDVLEHLVNPFEAVARLVAAVKPGGRLFFVTGNTATFSWRVSGSNYWYCALRDHVSFFCPSWFHYMAPRLGITVGSIERLSHKPSGATTMLGEASKVLAYRAYHAAPERLQRWRRVAGIKQWEIPWFTSARDHIMVEMQKQ